MSAGLVLFFFLSLLFLSKGPEWKVRINASEERRSKRSLSSRVSVPSWISASTLKGGEKKVKILTGIDQDK